MSEIVIRRATPEDNFDELYPFGAVTLIWNRELIFVAVDGEKLVGGIIIWDSEHPILFTGFLRIHPDYRDRMVGYRLMEAVEDYAADHNKIGVLGYTNNKRFGKHLEKLGALLDEDMYAQLFKVTM